MDVNPGARRDEVIRQETHGWRIKKTEKKNSAIIHSGLEPLFGEQAPQETVNLHEKKKERKKERRGKKTKEGRKSELTLKNVGGLLLVGPSESRGVEGTVRRRPPCALSPSL